MPFVGTLAVNRGFLNAVQVLSLVEDGEQSGKHFGDLAVERGMLAREQVDELLREQREALEPLGKCLMKLGILTRVQVEDLESGWQRESQQPAPSTTGTERGDG